MLLVAVTSCDSLTGEPDTRIPLEETLNEESTGAFLRVLSVDVAGFDYVNLDEAGYVFTAEYSDSEKGGKLENVEFTVSYTSNDYTETPPEIDYAEVKTVPASEFSEREESGLPSKQFEITFEEAITALGIEQSDVELGDSFTIQWTVNTTDGKSFGPESASPPVTGGFYSSPFQARSPVAILIDPEKYVGTYQITQQGPGTFGPVFESMQFEAELSVDPNNTLNGRVFESIAIGSPSFGEYDFPLTFARAANQSDNVLTLSGRVGLGLSCGGPEIIFAPEDDPTLSSFDVTDDSEFSFALVDNVEGACGGAPGTILVRFNAEKVN
ncbi:hypothetical protein CK503_10255 [Aliifodinibius salipaludis]|uniref:Uncharacterized protein n=2 Tax=Fodinibius salipaludis TaxID=2032627 RepID=A0A2A2G949_9BACT|nr:hypothetical protein CK503_10255 [Aliifodinibius salipaludis]